MRIAAILALILVAAGPLAAQTDLSGSAALDMRAFTQAPAFPDQPDETYYGSFSANLRLAYDLPSGRDRLVVAPFMRVGGTGDGRDHVDLREAYWLHRGEGWSLTAGFDKAFWGVTESRRLVDIVNQTDGQEDIDGEDKLGQPMLALSVSGDYGTVDLYALPWFRPLEMPAFPARLGGPAPLLSPTYDPGAGPERPDFAARWARSFGDVDLALSYFDGKSREPRLVASAGGFVPHYDLIGQTGLEVQYIGGDWLWKLEAIRRTGQGPAFWAATGGFERTLYGFGGGGADLGLIAEYSQDGRDPALAPATIYDKDIFLGARLALNDLNGTSLLAGALIDTKTDARVYVAEAQRRLGDNWRLSLEGRFFTGTSPSDAAAPIRSDDYLQLSFERFF